MPSADATLVAASLGANPRRWVLVPVVAVVGQRRDGGFDVRPAALVLERAPQRFGDERAAPTATHPLIELFDQPVLEAYV